MIEHHNYANLTTYIFKAEAALEATLAANGPGGNAGTGSATGAGSSTQNAAMVAKKREKEQVQSKLDLATAFSHLGQGNCERVAAFIFRLGPPKDLGDWLGKVSFSVACAGPVLIKASLQLITPADIAIYGALSALAGMSRGALKTQLEGSKHFGDCLEQEPYVRELLNAYMGSNFKTVLELLTRYSVR